MAVRILLVLVVATIFYGCGQSGSTPDQGDGEEGGGLYSAMPVGPDHLKSTTPVSAGQQLAFGIRRGGYDLYAMDPAGSNPTRLTDGVDPAWSPDGEQIAYTRYLKEPDPAATSASSSAGADPYTETPAIFVMNADGSGGKQLLNKAAVEPAWSPDGKKIAFALYTPMARYNDAGYSYCGIYVMDADGSGTPNKLVTGPGCAFSPAWSPGGRKIAYTNGLGLDESGGNSVSDVYVANAYSGEGRADQPHALTNYAASGAPGGASDPSWSPEGNEIAFTFEDQTGKTAIYKMHADGSGITPLAPIQRLRKLEVAPGGMEVTDSKSSPAWTSDGRIAYVRLVPYCDPNCGSSYPLYAQEIHMMNSDGSDPILVKDFGAGHDVWGLGWRPLVSKSRSMTVYPPDTGGPSLLLAVSVLLVSAGVLFYAALRL